MVWKSCDAGCGSKDYSEDNPFVEGRTQRPSDKSEMTCVIAGHLRCLTNKTAADLPSILDREGFATPEQWQAWIKSEAAAKAGFTDLG